MRLFCILLGITFMLVGAVFWKGKGIEWIKAWQQMEENEKQKINKQALEKNVAWVFVSAGVIFGLAGISAYFKEHFWMYSMIGWLILTGVNVYDIEKSDRYTMGKRNVRR